MFFNYFFGCKTIFYGKKALHTSQRFGKIPLQPQEQEHFRPVFHLTRRKNLYFFFINSLIFNKGLRKKSVYGRDDVFLWIFLL